MPQSSRDSAPRPLSRVAARRRRFRVFLAEGASSEIWIWLSSSLSFSVPTCRCAPVKTVAGQKRLRKASGTGAARGGLFFRVSTFPTGGRPHHILRYTSEPCMHRAGLNDLFADRCGASRPVAELL